MPCFDNRGVVASKVLAVTLEVQDDQKLQSILGMLHRDMAFVCPAVVVLFVLQVDWLEDIRRRFPVPNKKKKETKKHSSSSSSSSSREQRQ